MPRASSTIWLALALATLSACGIDFTKEAKPPGDGGLAADASDGTAGGHDGGTSGDGNTGDAGPLPDAGPIVGPECVRNADCGDSERFECAAMKCVEYECYLGKPCPDTDVCESHNCAAFVPPERFPTGYFQSSGGGTTSSSQYSLRLSAGMPQPMGLMSSGMYKMTIGPGAGRP